MGKLSGTLDPSVTWSPVDPDRLDLTGKRAAVVGGTGGIGRALAKLLARRGAEVTVVGRTFRDQDESRLHFMPAELSSMAEARRVGRELDAESLDVLVLTNGIMTAPQREETSEGLERDLAISYLSRLAVVREVAARLGTGRTHPSLRPRVFVMGFPGTGQAGDIEDFNSERAYDAFAAHMNTVAGNEALVLDAAVRYPQVDVYGLNPGLIKTDIRSNYMGAGSLKHRVTEWLIGLMTTSADGYARRIVPLLFSSDLDRVTGVHFDSKARAIEPSAVMTPEHVGRVIEVSEQLLSRALLAPTPGLG